MEYRMRNGRAVISAFSGQGGQQPVVRLLPPAKKKQKILDNMQSNPGGFVL